MQQIMEPNQAPNHNHFEIADEFNRNLTIADDVEQIDDDYGDSEDDFEFSFAGNELSSPVAADEVFQNGQIRPIFPFPNETVGNSEDATTSYGPQVKKLYVLSSDPEKDDDVADGNGSYCAWSPSAPEMSRKSNSTGLSKLWKVKDLLVRSQSDGKDAFVFLTEKKSGEKVVETASFSGAEIDAKNKKKVMNLPKIKVGIGLKVETTSVDEKNKNKNKKKKKNKSAYEALYGKREKTAGRSYLPYKQDLMGFFTNSNAISRNVHPY